MARAVSPTDTAVATTSRARPLRVLFQLPYPGYLRMYGSTLIELAERGHTVIVTYDMEKRREETADALEAHPNIEHAPPLPRARRRWEGHILELRQATDYSRYLDKRFARAGYLRRRLERNLSDRLHVLTRLPDGLPLARLLTRLLLALERLVPSDPRVEAAIREQRPDVVVVTPLVGRMPVGIRQTDTVKAARKLGVPVGHAVASWDQLTTKGLIKAVPDRVFVWNESQKREAVRLHRIRRDAVVVTGAQLFDRWFARVPSTTREQFVRSIGLDPARPYVLYTGSSRAIAPPEREIAFVREWLAALRADATLAELGVLIRPHPGNMDEWAQVELGDPRASVAPTTRPSIPMSPQDEELYYDSAHFAAAVVGINTSAIVESLIQRRIVLTVADARFRETQEGTLHFQHLLPESGGAVRHAGDLEAHLAQLREALASPDAGRSEIEAFLRTFVRPHGLDRPATPILADAIEQLAA